MTNVVARAVQKSTQSVRSIRCGESAPCTTAGRTIPPTARPTPKQKPAHTLTSASRHAERCISTMGIKAHANATLAVAAMCTACGSAGATGAMAPTRNEPRLRPTESVAETMPLAMNVGTAASERRERRERPHSPWPDVQPLASVAPRPIARPAAQRARESCGAGSKAWGRAKLMQAPAPAKPKRYPSFTPRSPRTRALRAPELPAMRPARSM
mmetsp:Transcript_37522/g.93282  ORF Transcript_37522/g.93282 Transcript_37522/m.93282 type:complete len:213 (+) Transcript_37522:468-1106(+)